MTADDWTRLKAVFNGALDQPADERRTWLRQACGGDDALLREAEALLLSHETAGDFLEAPARLDPADLETLPDDTELGAYRIVREIGRGGMGVVYLAHDTRLGRDVALKSLPPALAANPELRDRLRREARAAATIAHPAVATVYALEEIDGHLVIISEYVPGETLRALLTRGAIEASRAHAIAVQIAAGLAAAHQAGVIHRDLKPENVIVTPDGQIRVVDFGIAHIEGPEMTRLTRAGAMLGTPAYMAPEQLLGGAVDARADVYAFGIVLHEMLSGRHPLREPNAAPVTPHLAAIIARCVHPSPDRRYASGRELLDALSAEQDTRVAGAPVKAAAGSPRWWWEFHQAATATVYWVMTWPAWEGRQILGGRIGRALFIATLVAVIVGANLRLHLWFTSRFYPSELRWTRRRVGRWIRGADWLLVAALASMGILVGEDRSPIAIVLIAVAVGAAVAFLIIERATTRAAFRSATPTSDSQLPTPRSRSSRIP